jgi:HAD superfamily hydrolase (TIGR01509 family)
MPDEDEIYVSYHDISEKEFFSRMREVLKRQVQGIKSYVSHLTENPDEDLVGQLEPLGEYVDSFLSNLRMYSKAKILSKTQKPRWAMIDIYLVSNSSRKNTINTIESIGLTEKDFTCIITGDDVEHSKPDIEMYRKILEMNGLKPHEFLVFGDRETDAIPAIKLGMNAVVCDYKEFKSLLKRLISEGFRESSERPRENASNK